MEEDTIQGQPQEQRDWTTVPILIAVRHAESVANTKGIYQGQTHDTDLSKLGKLQAKAVARKLSNIGIGRLVTSPLKRCYQTAFEISRFIDRPINIDQRLIGTNHGEWEGKDKKWIKENYPDLYKQWKTKPSKVVFPQGEAFVNTVGRVMHFLERAALARKTVLISHDNVIRIILAFSRGLPLDKIWEFELEPAALTVFEITMINGRFGLKLLKENENDHLSDCKSDVGIQAL